LQYNYNNSSGSSIHENFNIRGNKTMKENTKKGHNNIIIKPPLQYNYNNSSGSSMHECQVSGLIHNYRTTLVSKYYKIGSSSKPFDDHKKILN
jgi:hypothetical protein